MFRFYWTLLRQIPRLLLDATGRTRTIGAIVLFSLAVSNQKWAKHMSDHWTGISPWWSAIPVVLLLFYGLLRANYERFLGIESERNAARTEFERLTDLPVETKELAQVTLAGLDPTQEAVLILLLKKRKLYEAQVAKELGPGFMSNTLNLLETNTPFVLRDYIGYFSINPEYDAFLRKRLLV